MASQKVSVSNVIGRMSVITLSVDTKELYVTMILRGDNLWDIVHSEDVQTAKAAHEQYVTMCQAFEPALREAERKHENGIPLDVDSFKQEVHNNYSLITVKKGMMH